MLSFLASRLLCLALPCSVLVLTTLATSQRHGWSTPVRRPRRGRPRRRRLEGSRHAFLEGESDDCPASGGRPRAPWIRQPHDHGYASRIACRIASRLASPFASYIASRIASRLASPFTPYIASRLASFFAPNHLDLPTGALEGEWRDCFTELLSYFAKLHSYFVELLSYFTDLLSYFPELLSYFPELHSYFPEVPFYFAER
jgi:hypothetical protein